jgi:hypothetical protein
MTRRAAIPTIRLDPEDVKPVQVQGEPDGAMYDPVLRQLCFKVGRTMGKSDILKALALNEVRKLV